MIACSTVTLPGLEEPVSGSSGRRHFSLTSADAKPLNYIRHLSEDLLYCTSFILDKILLCSSSIDNSEGQNLPLLPPSMAAGLQDLQRWKLCCLLCFVLKSNNAFLLLPQACLTSRLPSTRGMSQSHHKETIPGRKH